MVQGRRLVRIRRQVLGVGCGGILEMIASVVESCCGLAAELKVGLGFGLVVECSPLEAGP